MSYLAAIAVDKRQHYILSADRLQEMIGASELIASTVTHATQACGAGVEMVRPVSGEIWVRADDLAKLRSFLFQLRRQLVESEEMQVTFAVIEEPPDPKEAFVAIEHELQRQKANRETADGAPSSPFFARCNIQPELPPNIWRPNDDRGRKLISKAAHHKRVAARKRAHANPAPKPYKEPTQMQHLAASQANSYVALLKSDVDGLGKIQIDAPWSEVGRQFNIGAHEVVRQFTGKIEDAVQEAVKAASANLPPAEFYPLLPLVQAGDDLWLVARREIALQFAVDCGAEFSRMCRDELVRAVTRGRPLTLSFGVLFAKKGFPMDRQLDLADELLAIAKKRRHDANLEEGYLDYFWLDSAGYEGVAAARQQAEYILPLDLDVLGGGSQPYRLHTRPWTLAQTQKFLDAAGELEKLPARKLHQLAPILQMGGEFTRVGLQQWRNGLRGTETEALLDALQTLPAEFGSNLIEGAWRPTDRYFETALVELVELREILASGGNAE